MTAQGIDKRTHRRYLVEGVDGDMLFASQVHIINLSAGGAAVEADKRMNMGTDYALKLVDQGESFTVRGTVVWSNITQARRTSRGDTVPIYHAGLEFTRLTPQQSRRLQSFLRRNRTGVEKRLSGLRFIITHDHDTAVMDYPFHYVVRKLSEGGMLIRGNQCFDKGKDLTMEIFLDHHVPVSFTGRVTSCKELQDGGKTYYDVGIAFVEMSDSSRINLEEYLKILREEEGKA